MSLLYVSFCSRCVVVLVPLYTVIQYNDNADVAVSLGTRFLFFLFLPFLKIFIVVPFGERGLDHGNKQKLLETPTKVCTPAQHCRPFNDLTAI